MQNQAGIAAAEPRNDLFVLTDEQILEIAPASTASAPVVQPFFAAQERTSDAAAAGPENQSLSLDSSQLEATSDLSRSSAKTAQPEMAVPLEPPAWLAAQMQD